MIKRLISFIRRFFSFNYAEAKGFLVMAGGIAILAAFYLVYNSLPGEGYNSYSGDKAYLDSLVSLIEARKMPSPHRAKASKASFGGRGAKNITYFSFNPNQLSVDSLQLLGLPEWLAQRIDNYRKKGGEFRKKEDLAKIYGLPDSLYASLEPYITLPSPLAYRRPERAAYKSSDRTGKKAEETPSANSINLNLADSLELQQLKGIGPVLSSRIIKFRNKLGGFVHPSQLSEVYGLDSSVVGLIKEVTYIAPDFQPEKIALNTADREALAAHPYIGPGQARLIIQYREQHGSFASADDLRRIHTLDEEFVRKIAPYIRLD